ncbi:hypothetical protein L917_10958 [Phytophthora nicotianae]|uniref:Uncharacterized protein n=2 Tax=Phytophthora nicotianae TaxID=4792 RepID=V9EZZ0_PHYNI|nr:hypothetical protein F443_11463 [Phytophthora nicotianae P1569]ETL90311.1 hypothetical protein L917_10958 [Phytophthora nicotianae]ETM43616.1 hypothetical protein L914_10984 [Phytophthora nicotianae]
MKRRSEWRKFDPALRKFATAVDLRKSKISELQEQRIVPRPPGSDAMKDSAREELGPAGNKLLPEQKLEKTRTE